jgi:hypothetical protein
MEIGKMLEKFLNDFLEKFNDDTIFKLPELDNIRLSEIVNFLNNPMISSTHIGIYNACVELSKVIENCKVIYNDLDNCDKITFNNFYKNNVYKKALEKSEEKGEREVA